jgi:hypothetical protein
LLMNWSLQKMLHLDELNTIKKQYNANIHTSHTDVTPFSFLQYCQHHKVKHCVLTTVENATHHEVTFFWILGKKEMSVTFLNVKKSKQKPPGGVYCLRCNVL